MFGRSAGAATARVNASRKNANTILALGMELSCRTQPAFQLSISGEGVPTFYLGRMENYCTGPYRQRKHNSARQHAREPDQLAKMRSMRSERFFKPSGVFPPPCSAMPQPS